MADFNGSVPLLLDEIDRPALRHLQEWLLYLWRSCSLLAQTFMGEQEDIGNRAAIALVSIPFNVICLFYLLPWQGEFDSMPLLTSIPTAELINMSLGCIGSLPCRIDEARN